MPKWEFSIKRYSLKDRFIKPPESLTISSSVVGPLKKYSGPISIIAFALKKKFFKPPQKRGLSGA